MIHRVLIVVCVVMVVAVCAIPIARAGDGAVVGSDDGPTASWLDGWELAGKIAFETRFFPESPLFPGQFEEWQPSVVFEPEFSWENEERTDQLSFVPFGRIDGQDDERTHFDIREAYWRRVAGEWEFLIGAQRVFWGVTESRHLVNIINQIDTVEDIDEEDFLGQPMLQIARQTDLGRFELFLMTGFRERTFPDREGRLRAVLPVDTGAAVFESGAARWRPEVALRYTHFLGDVDIGLHLFHGTGREPELAPSADGTRLIPRYVVINQAGIDLQYTTDAWLWKFEGIVREGQGRTFFAGVGGVEYTIFQVLETDADLGVIVEFLYDDRDGDTFPTIFDQDFFFGARLGFNDIQASALLVGLVTDISDGLESLRFEFERRLTNNLFLEFTAQVFLQGDLDNPASAFEEDSFLDARLSLFF